MKYLFSLQIALATLVGCSVSPALVNEVPTKSTFSERQLIEDGVLASADTEKLRLNSGYFPNIKSAIIDNDLDKTWNAVLNDIAGTEEIRNVYFDRSIHKFDERIKLINSAEYQELTRRWGLIEFRLSQTDSINNKDHAQLVIYHSKYNPEDAIEAPTGWTFFSVNPVISRHAYVVVHFHRKNARTAVTVLNYMSYRVRVGNGSLAYPTEWKQFQAVSKGNIEQSIIDNILNAAGRTAEPIIPPDLPQKATPAR